MPPTVSPTSTLRASLIVALLLAALVGLTSAPASRADVASDRAAAAALRKQVAAESARIASTGAGLADAERRLAVLDGRVEQRRAQVIKTQDALIRARAHLARLEQRAAAATTALRKNLVAAYETGTPDLVSVIVSSTGFANLLERADFYKRVRTNNGIILGKARSAKLEVAGQTKQLDAMRVRFGKLAASAEQDRNQAAIVRTAILTKQQAQLEKRDGTSAKLATIKSRIARVEKEQADAARRAASADTATQDAPPITSVTGNSVVDRVIAGANQIASTPYVWGGGHGSFQSSGYDCSGSVSYALAAGGLLSTPLDSTGFESWGEPGPGKRITVYANAGHAYMYVDGRRFDTSALSGGGTRWTTVPRSNAGFVARHPAGY